MDGKVLKKIGTLGGAIRVNPKMKSYYFGDNQPGGALSKEKLFGVSGDLFFGRKKREMAIESTVSDTKPDLVRELQEKGLTREEAVETVRQLIRDKTLVEVWDEDRGEKTLVLRGDPKG